MQPIASLHVPFPISWADEERDLTSWLGNELQDEAFSKLFLTWDKVKTSDDPDILSDWGKLQTSDHFYYMCTKWFSDGSVHKYFNPYSSPYEAFINYMNVLSDFIIRIDDALVVKQDEVSRIKETKKKPASEEKISNKSKTPTVRTGKLDFEDIINLSDKKIKEIIKTLPLETVSYAMKGADKEIRSKVEKTWGRRHWILIMNC